MFLIACVIVLAGMTVFGPDELRVTQHRALGGSYAVLVGFLAYFSGGSTKLIAESEISGYAKVGLCLMLALVAAAAIFALWEFGLAPISRASNL